MKKLIFTIILSVLATGAWNICSAKEADFNDVTNDTAYYADIQKLNEMDILNGYEDGNFRPENKITVAEGNALTERVFGKSDISLDQYLFLEDTSRNMSYETAAELLMKATDLAPISAEMWGMRNTSFNLYLNTLYIRGYEGTNKEVPYSAGAVTRAEFCHMIAYMLDYDGTYTIPLKNPVDTPISVYRPDQLKDSNAHMLTAKSMLLCVPEGIRKAFTADGGEILIVPHTEWLDLFPDGGRYTGFYTHENKTIHIHSGNMNSIVHEFGHYLHSKLQENGYDISTDNSFKRQLGLFRYNHYYMTDDKEFFAEAFDVYCKNPEQLKNHAPEVYEYIDKAVKAFDNRIE